MRTTLYVIWLIIPGIYLLLALWSKLEQISNKAKKEDPRDFLRQGFYVLLCAGFCILIDRYVLEIITNFIDSPWLPLGFLEAILFPIVLLVTAKLFGGSKEIRIEKAPRPSQPRKK